ncbi:hypothetical protein [Roseiconus nitratireducens]|nr:hypothetical protein [Roseiconus nitratireducens]
MASRRGFWFEPHRARPLPPHPELNNKTDLVAHFGRYRRQFWAAYNALF